MVLLIFCRFLVKKRKILWRWLIDWNPWKNYTKTNYTKKTILLWWIMCSFSSGILVFSFCLEFLRVFTKQVKTLVCLLIISIYLIDWQTCIFFGVICVVCCLFHCLRIKCCVFCLDLDLFIEFQFMKIFQWKIYWKSKSWKMQ